MIEYGYGDGIEVVLGGGWRNFYTCGTAGPDGGRLRGKKCRTDNRNLTEEWKTKFNNSAYVTDRTQLKNIDANKVDHLLGMCYDFVTFLPVNFADTHYRSPSAPVLQGI